MSTADAVPETEARLTASERELVRIFRQMPAYSEMLVIKHNGQFERAEITHKIKPAGILREGRE